MVLYSPSKFFILKPFTNIQLHRSFDLGFWQTSEEIYRKLQHGEKIFAKFQSQPRLPRKKVLYSLTKFGIRKARSIIASLRRFDLRFFQTSKQIYRKLQNTEKVFGRLQRLSRFPSKMNLYLPSKFIILRSFTNIQLHKVLI